MKKSHHFNRLKKIVKSTFLPKSNLLPFQGRIGWVEQHSLSSLLLCTCLFLLSSCQLKPQPSKTATISCATDEILKELRKTDSNYLEKEKQQEKAYREAMSTSQKNGDGTICTLPVVVHIIHNNGSENISDAQVVQGLEYLNQAFRNLGYYNPATGVDDEIEFCLAQRDPNGNSTNGIIRYQSPATDMSTGFDHGDIVNLASWPSEDYINIRLVKEACLSGTCNAAGYAYLPSAHGWIGDGIVMESYYFGSSPGNTTILIHEMGHYLGLLHTFTGGCGNGNCLSQGDRVCDTPPDNSTLAYACEAEVNSCSTDAEDPSFNNPFRDPSLGGQGDQVDIHQNYLDYGNVLCHDRFTQGQKARMYYFLQNVRSSLLESKGCLPPCPTEPTALFTLSADNIDTGNSILFTNTSSNAGQYQWSVNGGLVSETTNLNHMFIEQGVYRVSLVATNGQLECSSALYEQTITVNCPINALFFQEVQNGWLVFEDLSVNNNTSLWEVRDGDGSLLFSSTNPIDSIQIGTLEYVQLSLLASNDFCEDFNFVYVNLTIDDSEICNNGIDDDSDGLVDLFDPNCACDHEAYQAYCPVNCEYLPDSFPDIQLQLKWMSEVTAYSSSPANIITIGDINGDGLIEIAAPSVIRTDINNIDNQILIIEGETGNTIQSIDLSILYPIAGGTSTPLLADIDADGLLEIFAEEDSRFYCFNSNGDLLWVSDVLQDGIRQKEPNIADFNGDGIPEIYVGNEVMNAQNGKLLLNGVGGEGCYYFNQWVPCWSGHSIAADLFPNSPGLELAAGNTVYQIEINNLNGIIGNGITPIVAPAPVVDGVTSIGDIDGDGLLDVIVVAANYHPDGGGIWVWNPRTLSIIASADAGEFGGVAFIGDVTGDCLPEIGMTFRNELRMYQYDGSSQLQLLYSLPTTDNSGYTGITMFDFNQDGKQELIYQDETSLRVLDGETGFTLASYSIKSTTTREYPLVADVDQDGQAEILVLGQQGGANPELRVYCFGSGSAPWAPARSVWNQYSYHVTNVNDDLTIPRYQQNGAIPLEGHENCLRPTCSTPYNNFMAQATYRTQEGCVQFPAADLTLDIVGYNCSPDSLVFNLAISSQGSKKIESDSDCIYISAYADGSSGTPSQTTLFQLFCHPTPIDSAIWYDTIRVAIPSPFSSLNEVYWVINDMGNGANAANHIVTQIIECNYDNNTDFIQLDIAEKQLDLGSDITKCASEVLTLNAGAGFENYLWNDNTTDSIYSSSFAGAHFVETTDHCGRIYRDTVVVFIDPTADIDLGTDILACPNDEIVFSLPSNFEFASWLPSTSVNCDDCLDIEVLADTSFMLIVIVGEGDCFSTDTVNIQFTERLIVEENQSICAGDQLFFMDTLLQSAGVYAFPLNDCDSILILDLAVNVADTLFIEEYICEGDSILFGGSWLVNNDVYTLTETNFLSCDSLIVLDLRLIEHIVERDTLTVCEGDSISVFDQWVSTAGVLSETYPGFASCDSTQVFYIETNPLIIDTVRYTVCEGDSLFIGGTWLSEAGAYNLNITAQEGCDTALYVELEQIAQISNLDTLIVCEGDSISVFGQWFFDDAFVSETFIGVAGCDSIQSFQILPNPLIQTERSYDLCPGDSVLVGTEWFSEAGVYTVNLTAQVGCDTVVEVEIMTIPPVVLLNTLSVCTGDSVLVEGEWLSQTGIYVLPTLFQSTCDTFFQIELIEIPVAINLDTIMICEGDSMNVFGEWIVNDTLINDQFIGSLGCDSIQFFRIISIPFITNTVHYALCEGDSVKIGNEWLSEAGFYQVFLHSEEGCDTIQEVEITEIAPVFNRDSIAICQSDSVQLFGVFFSDAGEYSEIFTGNNGCDSTQTYFLEIIPYSFAADTIMLCEGDSVFLGHQWVRTLGVYLDTLVSLPCNTILSTRLELKEIARNESTVELCSGDSILLNNTWVIAPDEVELIYTSVNGCDSIQLITITALQEPERPSTAIDCDKLEIVVTIESVANWEIRWDNGDNTASTVYFGGETASVALSSTEPPCETGFSLTLPTLPSFSGITTFQDTSLRKGHDLHLKLDLDPSEWTVVWSPSEIFSCDTCLSTVVNPIENTTVDFYYTHHSGCIYLNSFKITIEEEPGIYVPNVFSPNKDGVNDTWNVLPPNGVSYFDEVLLFSRWGSLVASWKGVPEIKWDGTFNGELMNPGVFVYYIRYTSPGGEKREKKGDVTILR